MPGFAWLLLPGELRRAFFRPPAEAVKALQLGDEQRVEAGEQADVIGGVAKLCRIERAGEPVAAGLAFIRLNAEVMLHQRGVADGELRRAEGEAGLGVADTGGQAAAKKLHQFQVLCGGVQHDGRRMAQKGCPRYAAVKRVV